MRGDRANPRPAGRWLFLAAVAGWVAAAVYCSFVLQPVTGGELSWRTTFVSELSARDQPGDAVYRVADLVAGALITVLGLGLCLDVRRHRPWLAGSALLVVFGIGTVAIAAFPMDCVATADEACAAAERSLAASPVHLAHEAASVVTNVAIMASILLIAIGVRRWPGWRTTVLFASVSLPALIVFGIAVAAPMLLTGRAGPLGWLRDNLGILQRAMLVVHAGWMAVLATALFDRRRFRPPSGALGFAGEVTLSGSRPRV